MLNKKNTLIIFLLLFSQTSVFANSAIVNRNYQTENRSSITRSNISRQNIYSQRYDLEIVEQSIKTIKQQIKTTPEDYQLYAALSDLYLKSKQYELALENNIFLYNLKKTKKLNAVTLSTIKKTFSSYSKLTHKESGLYQNLAVMALISNSKKSVDYVIAGIEHSKNKETAKKLTELFCDSNQNPEQAINLCEKILSKNPNNAEVKKIKAIYLVQQGKKQEAINEYVNILKLNNNDNDSRYNLYKLLTSLDLDDKELLKRLYNVTSSSDYENAYVSLTELLMKNKDFTGAKHYAEKLKNKYEKNPNGYILMSEIYKMEGKTKEAYETLSQARDKADDNKTMAKYNVMLAKLSDEPVKEANNLIANGLYSQAVEVLNSANPEALYVILTQARANYLLGEKQKSFDYLNKAMSLYPNNSDVYCAFGYIYLQEKDTETARKYVNNSLKLNNKNSTAKDLLELINRTDSDKYKTNILDSIEAQNFTEALRLVNEALEIDNKSADLYYYKSLVYISMSKYSDATATLYKCIELNKNYTDAYFYLGVTFDNLNEKENALENYKIFIKLSKGNEIGSTEKIDYAKARINKL